MLIFDPDYVRCYFESDYNILVSKDISGMFEVFYAQTKETKFRIFRFTGLYHK